MKLSTLYLLSTSMGKAVVLITLLLLIISILLASCSKKTTQPTHKLSEDLCLICDSAVYHVMGTDTVQVGNIISTNDDSENDCFTVRRYLYHDNVDSAGLTISDRDGKPVIHFDHYMNDWPRYIPAQNRQDLTGIPNGLYRYELSFPSGTLRGSFIIIYKKDEYTDTQVSDAACYHCCRYFDPADPAFVQL